MNLMNILAIETSCDETAIALVEASGGLRAPKFRIVSSVVSSQVKIHAPFGGVVPNLAKREHIKNLPIVLKRVFQNSPSTPSLFRVRASGSRTGPRGKFDLLAVTVGPGLEPALWTGIEFAKKVKRELDVPAVGVNHLEGHLYSFLLSKKAAGTTHKARSAKRRLDGFEFRISNFEVPAIALLVSGGHTILVLMESLAKWYMLGETRDDAAGEAFDKVARMLHLSYPGGAELEKLARKGRADTISFPRPMIHAKDYDFSFSGLKTSVLYYMKELSPSVFNVKHSTLKNDIAASFQAAVIDVLVTKTVRAAREYGAKSIMLSGGVAANRALRRALQAASRKLRANFFVPPFKFNTDNAAMIGVAGYMQYLKNKTRAIRAQGN